MSNLGNITTSSRQIITEVANVVSSTYGVIGVSSSDFIKESINFLANNNNLEKGIVLNESNGDLSLDLYIVIAFDFKADIVLSSLEQNIRWALNHKFDVELDEINFFITNVGRIK